MSSNQKPGSVKRAARVLLVVQSVVAIALLVSAIVFFDVRSPAVALLLGVASVLLLRMLINANNFVLAWIYWSPTPLSHRLTGRQVLPWFLMEFGASMISSSWNMAFRGFDKKLAKPAVGLPVLLIHGYGCNSGYWHSMSKALSAAHISHYAIDLEPVLTDIDELVPLIDRTVERICAETGESQIVILAHSMGGLVARAYLRKHGGSRIRRLITLGTPHQGTGLAKFGVGISSKQMRWHGNARSGHPSSWLNALEKKEEKSIRERIVSIYSHHDNIVSPQVSAHLRGAKNLEFKGIGHVFLGFSKAIQAVVIREILAASQDDAKQKAELSAKRGN